MADRFLLPPGLIIAAPASGSGKTTVTLGILRALRDRGTTVVPFKVGPDYIDPGFHTWAAGRDCTNLDPWAMRRELIDTLIAEESSDGVLVICEAVMGLFDGATAVEGASADLAAMTGWPVVLVVDAARQASSAAALVRGFANHRPDVHVAGVIFNRVGTPRHRRHIEEAMVAIPDVPILGFLPTNGALSVPSRYLGLVQTREIDAVEKIIAATATHIADHIHLDMLEGLAGSSGKYAKREIAPPVPPLGQRIAVAVDAAFGFTYPHVLDGWRKGGAEIIPFSPLADEAPNPTADAIYLPGGYPELYAGTIAARATVLDGLRMAATAGKTIFGECGGYMVLGRALTDADGTTHVMAGLLPVETSFAKRALQLGYREATVVSPCVLGPAGTVFRGHEFHYATMIAEDTDGRLFTLVDAFGDIQPSAGHICGSIAGSFIHLIDSLRANPAVLSIR